MRKTQNPGPGVQEELSQVGSAEAAAQIAEAIHALRDGMNSRLMNTAVLGARIDDVPESLRPFVELITKAGYRCSEDLTRQYALLDARKR